VHTVSGVSPHRINALNDRVFRQHTEVAPSLGRRGPSRAPVRQHLPELSAEPARTVPVCGLPDEEMAFE
jgi:predicted GNAT family acetyltransferase